MADDPATCGDATASAFGAVESRAEIEITPEMIEAGALVLSESGLWDHKRIPIETCRSIVREILDQVCIKRQ